MTSTHFYTSGKAFKGCQMLNLKFPAAIAAVVLMSSVSAQAMEFDDLPVLISGMSSPSTVRAMPSVDRSRRQIDNHVMLLPVAPAGTKLADRPRPISNLILARVAHRIFGDRPGRLSAEFSAVSKGSGISFENRPGQLSNRFRPIATPTVMRFENRPGSVSNRFKTLAARTITFEDRSGYTSSLSKATNPFIVHTVMGSANQHRNVYEIRFTIKSGHTYRQRLLQPRVTSTKSAVWNRTAVTSAVVQDNN
jgi:hypothetical protein